MAMSIGRSAIDRSQWARGASVVLGVWLFISAFVWPHSAAQQTDTWILGVLFAVCALVAMSSPQVRYANTVLAIWLFISVWALPHRNLATMWNNALVAIAVFLLSLVPATGESGLMPRRAEA